MSIRCLVGALLMVSCGLSDGL